MPNNAVAAPSSEPSSGDAAASLKKRIVALAAASGRGLDATAAQKAAAASLIADLIAVNPTSDPAMSAKVNGDWELQSVKRSREKTLSQTFLAFFFFFTSVVSSFRLVVSHILPRGHRTVVLGVYVVLLFPTPGPGAEGARRFLFFFPSAAFAFAFAFFAAFSSL